MPSPLFSPMSFMSFEDRRSLKSQCDKTYQRLIDVVKEEGWLASWRNNATYQYPQAGIWPEESRRKRGERVNQKLINSVAVDAADILASGMMSGLTSPEWPWFELEFVSKLLKQNHLARGWLEECILIMRQELAGSNFYRTIPTVYKEEAVFGSAHLHQEWYPIEGLEYQQYTIGSFLCENGAKGIISRVYNEMIMSPEQIAEKFGTETMTSRTKARYQKGEPYEVVVRHAVEPSDYVVPGMMGSMGRPIRSVWWEMGSEPDELLHVSSYDEMPDMVTRWETIGNDAYGRGPGDRAQGDVEVVHEMEQDILDAEEMRIQPPANSPSGTQRDGVNMAPGTHNEYSPFEGAQGVFPVFQIQTDIQGVEHQIVRHENQVNRAYYAHVWQMLTEMDAQGAGRALTATEVQERASEKRVRLVPALQRTDRELNRPNLRLLWNNCVRFNRFPEPPQVVQEDQGGIEIHFVSQLAQAMKAVKGSIIGAFVQNAAPILEISPSSRHVADWDEMLRHLGEIGPMPVSTINDEATTEALQLAEQRAMEQQRQAELMREMAGSAQSLGQAPVTDDNMLGKMQSALGGAAAVRPAA